MGANNIGEYFTNLSKISDDLHTPKKIKVEVRPITGGRRFSVVDEKGKKFEFSIKDLINHTLSLAKGAQSTPDQKAKLEGIVTKLKSLDQEGKDLLDSDETRKIARLLTQIRSLFGNLFHGKKTGMKELSSILDLEKVMRVPNATETEIPSTWGALQKAVPLVQLSAINKAKENPSQDKDQIHAITDDLQLNQYHRVSSNTINHLIAKSKTPKGESLLPLGILSLLGKEQIQGLVLSELTDSQLNSDILKGNAEKFQIVFGDELKLLQAHIHRLERSNMKLISLETFQKIDFTKLSALQMVDVIEYSTKAQARMIPKEQLDKLDLSLCAKEELDKLCGRNSKRTLGLFAHQALLEDRDAMLQKNPTYKRLERNH